MNELVKSATDIAKAIRADIPDFAKPPAEGFKSATDQVIPLSYVRNTRGYIEKLANQINGCYERGWFDACAVMIRRLCEVLIIEVYESKNMSGKIKDGNNQYFMLEALIKSITTEPSWTLNRFTVQAFPQVADAGNLSAHSIRFNAHVDDIDRLVSDFRVAVQDLLALAGIKK